MLEACELTRSALLGLDKAGVSVRSRAGDYDLEATMRVALAADLRDVFPLEDLARLWSAMEEDGTLDALVKRACSVGDRPLDLVIEPHLAKVTAVGSDKELLTAVRRKAGPRTLVFRPQTERLRDIETAFSILASEARRPTSRKVGRPAKEPANLRAIRGGAT